MRRLATSLEDSGAVKAGGIEEEPAFKIVIGPSALRLAIAIAMTIR